MQITAAIARTHHAPLSLEPVEIDMPRAGELRVRVTATGICHTDLVVRDGMLPTPLPVVLGHEGAGIVEAVGPGVSQFVPGDRIVMTYDSCGRCGTCREHAPFYCEEFFGHNFAAGRQDGTTALTQDGKPIRSHFFGQSSFATFAICREDNAVRVPADVPLELLGPLACGFQTGAGAVINGLRVSAGRSFAVVGAGAVGLAALMAAKAVGATTIIAVDVNPARLELARELGATHVFNPKSTPMAQEILKLTGHGVQYALDTTGLTDVIKQTVLSLAPRGTAAVVGASALGTEIVLDEVHFMSGGRRLMGIVEGESNARVFIPQLIELWRQGVFPFDRLIRFYPFEEINQAIADSISGHTIKPVVKMP